MTDAALIFDRALLRRRRERAAATFAEHDFLVAEVAARLADRLEDVQRRFPLALDLGCHTGQMSAALAGSGKVERTVAADLAPAMVAAAGGGVVADEEALPFADGRFDLVVSCLNLHWVNDLPGALVQIRRALKPDGLFLAAMLGGETLTELRDAWLRAEAAEEDGAGLHVSPFADLRDAAGLLQRAGFALPVSDTDRLTATYADPLRLMAELQGMGESNALLERRHRPTRRATLLAATEQYVSHHAGADGRVPATFQVIYLTGWAPAASQQQPLRPGAATTRLADALDTVEQPSGERAGR